MAILKLREYTSPISTVRKQSLASPKPVALGGVFAGQSQSMASPSDLLQSTQNQSFAIPKPVGLAGAQAGALGGQIPAPDQPIKTEIGMIDTSSAISQITKQKTFLDEVAPPPLPPKPVEPTKPTEIAVVEPPKPRPDDIVPLPEKPLEGEVLPAKSPEQSKLEMEYNESADQVEGLTNDFLTYNVDQDPDFQRESDNIKAQFAKLKDEMRKTNFQRQRAFETLGFRTGATQYAGSIQMGIEGEELNQGNARLAELTRQENLTISGARAAFRDGKFNEFNQKVNALRDLREQKSKQLFDYNQKIANLSKKLQDDRKIAIDEARFAMEIDSYKQEQMQTQADAVGMSLVILDENFEVSQASPEQVRQLAEQMGIDPSMLMASMSEQASALRKESREERGSFFDRQQFAADEIQRQFSNSLDVQKFALEDEIFGYKVSQDYNESMNGKIVSINGKDYIQYPDGSFVEPSMLGISDDANEEDVAVGTVLQDKLALIDSILGNERGLKGSVGTYGIVRWSPFAIDKADRIKFAGEVQRLISKETLDSLLNLKRQGGTLGALSDQERIMLRDSATAIGNWIQLDSDGNPTGKFEVSREVFIAEVNRIKDLAQAAYSRLDLPVQPIANLADFHKRAQTNPELDRQWDWAVQQPKFKSMPDSVEKTKAIIQFINTQMGAPGELGGGSIFASTVQKTFPTNSKGGQCGTFAHKLVDFPPVGDMQSEKFASVRKFGMIKSDWLRQKPRVGDVIITNENKKYGHVAVINKILPGGRIQLSESNFGLDEKIDHNRILNMNSPKIYGAIRGNLKLA